MGDLKEAPEGLQEHPAPELTPEEAAEEKRPSHLTPEGETVTGGADKALQEMATASRETPQEILAATRESMQGLMQTAQAALEKTKKAMFAVTESIQKYWDEFGERITAAVDTITEFIGSDLYRSLEEVMPDAHRIFDIHTEDPEGPAEMLGIFGIAEFIANLESALPFIREEAAAYKERTGQTLTAAEFFRDTDPATGAEIESIYYKTLRAQEVFKLPQVQALAPSELEAITPYLQDACYTYLTDTGIMTDVITGEVAISDLADWTDEKTGKAVVEEIIERAKKQAAEAARGSLRSTGGRKVKMLDYPIDKVNNTVWNLLEENTHGQMVLNLKAEPNGGKHKKVDITYSINFDNIESDLPMVKRLTPFDKRVYIAVGALWSAGNDSVTIEEIARAMGYETEPNDQLRKKIDASMTKFHAVVTIDNGQEIAAGYKYPRSGVDGPLLPFYRGREYKNGQLTAVYVITLYVEGRRISKIPLIEFAAGRGQVTQLPRKVLQTPLNKTDENLRIEDYCIERIARHKKEGKKILLSTLYSKCGITDRKHKERAPEKIERLFDYYKTCGEVKDYKLTKDAITFEV